MSDSDRDGGEERDEDGWKFDPDAAEEQRVEQSVPSEEVEDLDGEWRFSLDEVGEDGVVERSESIEPGPISRENAVFVVLGALAMVFVFVRLWMVLT